MSGLGWQAAGLALALLAGLAAYLLAGRYGQRLWAAFQRRGEGDAVFIHETCERLFREIPLAHCRLMVWGSALAGLALGAGLTWHLAWPALAFFSLVLGYVAWGLPRRLAAYLGRRYVGRFADQLVDALTMLASALRSGLSLPQSLDMVGREMPNPMSQELALVLKEQQMGRSLDEALEALATRVPSEDLGLVVNSVLILRETGGNLAETFDTIVYTISERDKVRGKIKTLTAQGVAQGMILTAMPFVLAWVLYLINPDYMRPLFTTALGWVMLGFMGLLLTIGGLMIRKIVSIDV